MKLYELLENVEIQCDFAVFCYYDYLECERVLITKEQALDKNVRYIYVEADELYIEIDNDEEVEKKRNKQ